MFVASCPWISLPSKLGPIDVPLASLEVQDVQGEWKKYTFKIDSGAVITVMYLEHVSDLGIKLNLKL